MKCGYLYNKSLAKTEWQGIVLLCYIDTTGSYISILPIVFIF